MVYGRHCLTIPSNDEYSVPQLTMLLREVEAIIGRAITAEAWGQTRGKHPAPLPVLAAEIVEVHSGMATAGA